MALLLACCALETSKAAPMSLSNSAAAILLASLPDVVSSIGGSAVGKVASSFSPLDFESISEVTL